MTSERRTITPDTAFVIWSHKHQMWWRPYERGYTDHIANAGVYTEADAREIERASMFGPEGERSVAMPLTHCGAYGIGPMQIGSVMWLMTIAEVAA